MTAGGSGTPAARGAEGVGAGQGERCRGCSRPREQADAVPAPAQTRREGAETGCGWGPGVGAGTGAEVGRTDARTPDRRRYGWGGRGQCGGGGGRLYWARPSAVAGGGAGVGSRTGDGGRRRADGDAWPAAESGGDRGGPSVAELRQPGEGSEMAARGAGRPCGAGLARGRACNNGTTAPRPGWRRPRRSKAKGRVRPLTKRGAAGRRASTAPGGGGGRSGRRTARPRGDGGWSSRRAGAPRGGTAADGDRAGHGGRRASRARRSPQAEAGQMHTGGLGSLGPGKRDQGDGGSEEGGSRGRGAGRGGQKAGRAGKRARRTGGGQPDKTRGGGVVGGRPWRMAERTGECGQPDICTGACCSPEGGLEGPPHVRAHRGGPSGASRRRTAAEGRASRRHGGHRQAAPAEQQGSGGSERGKQWLAGRISGNKKSRAWEGGREQRRDWVRGGGRAAAPRGRPAGADRGGTRPEQPRGRGAGGEEKTKKPPMGARACRTASAPRRDGGARPRGGAAAGSKRAEGATEESRTCARGAHRQDRGADRAGAGAEECVAQPRRQQRYSSPRGRRREAGGAGYRGPGCGRARARGPPLSKGGGSGDGRRP